MGREISQRALSGCQPLKAVLRCLDFSRDAYEKSRRYFKQRRVMGAYGLHHSFSKHKNKPFFCFF